MSLPPNSRVFLRGRTVLTLLDGGMAAGGPVTPVSPLPPKLIGCYLEWLRLERQQLGDELGLVGQYGEIPVLPGAGAALLHHREMLRTDEGLQPSSRAEAVLTAIGCDWTGGRWA